jgi:hypothetical protein
MCFVSCLALYASQKAMLAREDAKTFSMDKMHFSTSSVCVLMRHVCSVFCSVLQCVIQRVLQRGPQRSPQLGGVEALCQIAIQNPSTRTHVRGHPQVPSHSLQI